VGILVPIASVDMNVKSKAKIITSPENSFPGVHSFVGALHGSNDAASDDATGLGDIVLRAKYSLLKSDIVDISGAVLTKLETADEKDFLGTGTTTIRPFLVFSRTFSDVFAPYINFLTPHLNLGYEFNVEDNNLSSVEYAAGFDAGTEKFTVAGDILGSHEPDGDSIGDHIVAASVGVKWNVFQRLLLFANLQFPLNHQGLRSDLIPTLGVEYSF
jgi:hypothetical protein